MACNDINSKPGNSSKSIKALNDSILMLKQKNEILQEKNTELRTELEIMRQDGIYNEDFLSFIINFSENEDLQKERINLPITIEEAYIGFNDTTYTCTIESWDTKKYKFHSEGFNIYDNEEIKLRNSNYRVLRRYGIESCGDLQFYFKGKDGKWFLYKISYSG